MTESHITQVRLALSAMNRILRLRLMCEIFFHVKCGERKEELTSTERGDRLFTKNVSIRRIMWLKELT